MNSTLTSLTVEELRALGVSLLQLLTLLRRRLHVAVGGGEHGRARLHQELAHLDIIAGSCAVQGRPTVRQAERETDTKRESSVS